MSDWIYIVGEGGYNQDFRILDRQTGDPLDLSGASSIKMFITTTSQTDPNDAGTNFPVGGEDMTAVGDPLGGVARLVVQSGFMPDDADMYLAQIEIITTSTVSTFIINLRVIRSLKA